MFLSIGPWAPDRPDYNDNNSGILYNLIPRTPETYAPVGSLMETTTTALNGRCIGINSFADNAGNVTVFAGTQTAIEAISAGTATWSNISKSGGYSVAADQGWKFAQYGQQILACASGQNIQQTPIGTLAMTDLAAAAPQARYIAVVRDFVVVGFTFDATNGTQDQRVWWSAINNPSSWPTPGTSAALAVQSDYQDVAGSHGFLTGITVGVGYTDAVLFFERAIFRMDYSGYPTIFSFRQVEEKRGTQAPQSIVQVGSLIFYLGDDGFYMFDGVQSQPIGYGKVDRFFFTSATDGLDQTYLYRVSGAADPLTKTVWWAYPAVGNAAGTPNRIIVYNYETQMWALINGVSCDLIARTLAIGYSLESLSAVYPNLDTLPASLDSRFWTGDRPLLSAVDTNHFLATFTGANLAATADTSEQEINPEQRSVVYNTRPQIDGGVPSVAMAARNSITDPIIYGPATVENGNGECPQRVAGRFFRARVTVPAGSVFTHLSGVTLSARQSGRR